MAQNLLFEIGTEEIPARFMEPALKQMKELMEANLKASMLDYSAVNVCGTPRRLAIFVKDLAEMQPDVTTEVKGPAKKSAFDQDGNATRALQGFLGSQKAEEKDIFYKEIKGVEYVHIKKETKGQSTEQILPAILEEIAHKIYFPKPMRWGYNEMRFARPIRWIVALFGKDVLPVEIGGVKADRFTRGHRFLGSDHIELCCADKYVEALRENYVIVSQVERKELCRKQIEEAAKSIGGVVKEDEELLEEVTYILEYPTALVGKFDEKYLEMPVEMVITPMREHQRYFPVYKEDGTLMPNFITVRNGGERHLDIVTAGNEKVLTARLSDASFFWEEDCKQPLSAYSHKLDTIVFHEKLGTLAEKVKRVEKLANFIGEKLGYDATELADLQTAAKIGKCDLVTHAVVEFTELQGTMGKYYARVHGEKECVAMAMEEQYLPRFAGDRLPEGRVGLALALAERFDTLTGFFAADMIPTGSQDPYALRRSAIGICQMIIKKDLELSTREISEYAYSLYEIELAKSKEETLASLETFFRQRFENILSDENISYDVSNAIVANSVDNLTESYKKAMAINEFRGEEIFQELMAGFTRAANLIKNKDVDKKMITAVDPGLFVEDAEKSLYSGLVNAKEQVKSHLEANNYGEALEVLGGLRSEVDNFFNSVMVMADDEKVKYNRLALLSLLIGLTGAIGDLTKLVTK